MSLLEETLNEANIQAAIKAVMDNKGARSGRDENRTAPGTFRDAWKGHQGGNPEPMSLGSESGSASHFRFLRNPLGDVEGLVDQYGETVAEYGYDAWGLPLGTVPSAPYPAAGHARRLNPFRYRGYFYDEDLGLYLLGGRLYDPRFRQFTSLDSPDCLDILAPGGVNPYVYCFNDPVNYSDGSGHFPILLGMILIGAAVGALSYTASEVVSYGLTGEWSWSWGQFAGAVIGGAVGGALMASGAGAFAVGFGSGFVSTAVGMSLQNAFEGTNYSADRILALSLINGFISGGIAMLPSIGVPRITTGRNSFAAISASITKKYVNGTIRNMALKTMGKMFTYNLVTSAFDVAWSGFTDATGFDDSAYDYFQLIYGWLRI